MKVAVGFLLNSARVSALLSAAQSLPMRAGLVYGSPGGGVIDASQYVAQERYIDLLPPFDWLRPMLEGALDAAAGHYGIGPNGSAFLVEQPRLLSYVAGGHFGWHVDEWVGSAPFAVQRARRVLTGTIQLSNAAAYGGGDLDLAVPAGEVVSAPRGLGTVTLFPVNWRHRVRPVSHGVRQSLVFWGYARG